MAGLGARNASCGSRHGRGKSGPGAWAQEAACPGQARPGAAVHGAGWAGPAGWGGGKGWRWLASAGPLDDGTMTTRRGRRAVDGGTWTTGP